MQIINFLDLKNFNIKNVLNSNEMFKGCNQLQSIELSDNFKSYNLKYISNMYSECSSLINLDLSFFITNNIENMNSMFSNCKSLKELNITNFMTDNLKTLNKMFYNCESLQYLYLPYFDTSKIKEESKFDSVFENCTSLNLYIDFEKNENLIKLIPEYVNKTDI